MTKTLGIEGMSCGHCVKHTTDALSEVEGVTSVNVSLESKQAVVQAEGEVSDDALKAAVADAGYTVTTIS